MRLGAVVVGVMLGAVLMVNVAQASILAETVYFQENFSGEDLDYGYFDADAGEWIDGPWYDGDNYQLAEGRLALGQFGWVESNNAPILGEPSEVIFSGQWGSTGRELGMKLYNQDGNGVNVAVQYDSWYGEDGTEEEQYVPFLSIYDGISDGSWERMALPTEMTDFSMRFYGNGWDFSTAGKTWSFDENPFAGDEEREESAYLCLWAGWSPTDDETLDPSFAEFFGLDEWPASGNAYFSNLKVYSPTAAPEPVSCALFLLGGGVLLAVRRKNRK